MTELEEAELTEGQGRALSGHKTVQAYRGYAKETLEHALAATRKRHAHWLANTSRTPFGMKGGMVFGMTKKGETKTRSKLWKHNA